MLESEVVRKLTWKPKWPDFKTVSHSEWQPEQGSIATGFAFFLSDLGMPTYPEVADEGYRVAGTT